MCIKVGEHIFTGDTLFAGSIGRTDFYGGDYKQMMKSLRKLAKYDDKMCIRDRNKRSYRKKSTNIYLWRLRRGRRIVNFCISFIF